VVLVGGKGTRLRPLTLSAPKPMLPTAGLPFLTHLLSRIAAAGIEHVILSTSYKAAVFDAEFGDGSKLGLQIDYVTEEHPLGTGGGIANVAGKLRHDTVMVFNGDVLSGADLGQVLEFHQAKEADVTLHLVRVGDPRAFGCVPTEDGRVTAFLEKTQDPPTDQINAGCYVFKRARSFRRCSPMCTSMSAATSMPAIGATWARRKTSCAGRRIWCAASRRRRP
jgi:mannose-1-phosphate guanylyltransferase